MSIISDSNEQQQKAVTHGDGPQLIVAGAGTGKTRVITTRIAWLILEKNLKVDEVLALTFTDKAAQEMEERVDTMLPYGYVDLWISTFHSFCDKLLKRHALDIGLPDNYKLVNETEAWLLVKKNLDKFNLDYYRPLGSPTKFIHALLKHFSRCKDEGIYPDEYLSYAEEIKLNNDARGFVKQFDLENFSEKEKKELLKQEILRVAEVANAYHVYQQLLLENDCLDFGDLINYAIKLFKKRPLILDKYRQQFKYVLVDEFQDTNFVQYELIKLLALPKNNLTVVGDDNQSIYKFRGAAITNIMQFKKDFPSATEIVLTENYRSCQEILDLAYKFISQNENSLEKALGIDKKLSANLKESCAIEHLHEKTVEDEAEAVVQKIVALKNEKQLEWSSFAILVRANDSANIFINYLDQAKIPYQFLAMRGLYNKPIIIDLINYFKLLDNYHESSAVYRVLNFKFLNIEPGQIIKLVHFSKYKSLSLFETIKQAATISGITEQTLGALNKIIVQIEKDTQLAQNKKPSEVLLNFLYKSGLLENLQKEKEQFARENIGYIQQFFQKIQAFEADNDDPRLADFMEILEMEMQAGDSGRLAFDAETGPDMVKLMTVHSAKGLEFDYVFLASLVDRKFPSDERKEAIQIPDALIKESIPQGNFHLEEERRLFYVAMTRARKGLFFTSADNYGGVRDKKLSRFLVELDYSKDKEQEKKHTHTLVYGCADDLKKEQPHGIYHDTTKVEAEFKYELPKRFSFSQMQTYEKCPLRYKFANVLKIPTFGNHFFSFGSTIHNTLQKFLEQGAALSSAPQQDLFSNGQKPEVGVLPLEKLYEIYENCWQDEWYLDKKQKEEYFKKGKELLKNFHDNFVEKKPKVKMLEQMFNLKVGEYSFAGRIDRVDEVENGQVEIIDYKTGGAPKDDKLYGDAKQQLLFYQIAAEEVFKLNVEKLTYYFLEADKFVPFVGKDADKQKLKDRFLKNIEQIKAQNFEPKPNPMVCGYCEYKDICEYRKL